MSKHSKLYNNRTWRQKRAEQLSIEPLCRYCKARGIITVATVADHVVPHRGDLVLFWEGKLQSLCQKCHSGAKAELENTGRLRGCDTDGVPIDAGHHWNR